MAVAVVAPEFVERAAEDLGVAGRHGLEVRHHAGLGVLRSQDRVDVGGLVEVRVLHVRVDLEQRPRELEHVVFVAALGGRVLAVARGRPVRGVLVQRVRGVEVLGLAVAAVRVGVVAHHDLPEVLGGRLVHLEAALLRRRERLVQVRVVGEDRVALQCADELGDRGVGVLAVEHVRAGRELLEQRHLVEVLGRTLVRRVLCDLVERVQRLVHAAVLGVEQGGGIGLAGRPVADPRAEPARDAQRLRREPRGSVLVRGQQAGQHLVQVVEGHEQSVGRRAADSSPGRGTRSRRSRGSPRRTPTAPGPGRPPRW